MVPKHIPFKVVFLPNSHHLPTSHLTHVTVSSNMSQAVRVLLNQTYSCHGSQGIASASDIDVTFDDFLRNVSILWRLLEAPELVKRWAALLVKSMPRGRRT